MRDILGINISEKNAKIAALRETLNDDKKRVSDELVYYKSVAKDIKRARKRVEMAEAAYDKRESDKNAAKLEDANDELSALLGAFNDSEAQIKQLLEAVHTDYSNIADQYCRAYPLPRILRSFPQAPLEPLLQDYQFRYSV